MRLTVALLGMVLLSSTSCATAAAPEPGKKGSDAAITEPAADDISAEAKVILKKLEDAGKAHVTIEAEIKYTEISPLTGDTQTRTGGVTYQNASAGNPARFRISFKTLKLGEQKAATNRVDYLFDGNWLIIAKHKIKSITKVQIAAEGKEVDAFKIGKGPFPIPFGQKTGNMIKLFEAITRKRKDSDPENSDYLLLLPRREHKKDVNFTQLKIWINSKTGLPVEVHSKDKNKNRTKVTFENIRTPEKPDPKDFTMKKPAGWDITIEPLKK